MIKDNNLKTWDICEEHIENDIKPATLKVFI